MRNRGVAGQNLQILENRTPERLIIDNLNIHRRNSLTDAFGIEMGTKVWDRFTIHYTPKHGSWLNQAEIEIGLFARQCLGNRRIPTSRGFAVRVVPGTAVRASTKSRSTGNSTAGQPAGSLATNANPSSGHRTKTSEGPVCEGPGGLRDL